MSFRRPLTFQSTLIALLAVVLAPILLVQTYIYYDRIKTAEAEELKANLEVARVAGDGFDAFVQGVIQIELAIGRAGTSLPQAELTELLEASAKDSPGVDSFSVIGPDGIVVASNDSRRVGINISDRESFAAIAAGSPWAVGNLVIGKVAGKPVFSVDRAIRDRNGRLACVIRGIVYPPDLEKVLKLKRSGEAGITFIDNKGMLVYRSPDLGYSWEERNWLALYPIVGDALDGREVLTTLVSKKTGSKRLVAFTPIPSIGWVAAASRAESDTTHVFASGLPLHASLFLLAALGAFGASFLLSRRITAAIRLLGRKAKTIGTSEFSDPQLSTGPREIQDLSKDFTEISKEIVSKQKALRESEERLRTLGDNLPDSAVYQYVRSDGGPGRFTYLSAGIERLNGIRIDDALRDPGVLHGQILPDYLDRLMLEEVRCIRELTDFDMDVPMRRTDGQVRWMRLRSRPRRLSDGSIVWDGVQMDITERKFAEGRFRLLSETSAQLLVTEDPLKVINDLARRVMEHLECHAFFNFIVKEDGSGLRLNAYAGIPSEAANLIQHLNYGVAICGCVASERQRIIACDILNTADPRTELVKGFGIQAYCCHPIMTGDDLIGTLSFGTRTKPCFAPDEIELMRIVTDQVAVATERIRARGLLENAVRERTAALSTANQTLEGRALQLRSLASSLTLAERRERDRIARVLHDNLQQQLAVAKMEASSLKPHQMTPSHLAVAVERIKTLVADAIDASRSLAVELSPPVLHRGGLAEGFKWLAAWMQEKYGFEVVLDFNTFPAPTTDIKILLFESAREVLFNSFKHSGGNTANLVLDGDASVVKVTITDSGRGFDLAKLGQPGSGFGLFTISERLSLVQGSLEVDSVLGQGSRFVLTAPATNIVVEPMAEPSSAHQSIPKLRIVLADDHAVLRESLALVFRQEPDIEIAGEAENGEQAIELARRLTPDAILLDINMPKMNGIEATAVIHRENPAIRIIGLTMLSTEGDSAQRLREAGAAGLISKNASPQELICIVRDLCCPLDNRRATDLN